MVMNDILFRPSFVRLKDLRMILPRALWGRRNDGATSISQCTGCVALQWRHNERDGVSNHQIHDCLLKRLFRHRSKKTSKLRVTGLCEGKSPVTGEFPLQMASNTETYIATPIWRHKKDFRDTQSTQNMDANMCKDIFWKFVL